MNTWVLILMISGLHGISTSTIPFPTEAGCLEAGQKATKKFDYFPWNVHFTCVEKK